MSDPFAPPPDVYDDMTVNFDRLLAPLSDEALRTQAAHCLSSYLTAVLSRLGYAATESLMREVCADIGLRPEKAA